MPGGTQAGGAGVAVSDNCKEVRKSPAGLPSHSPLLLKQKEKSVVLEHVERAWEYSDILLASL